MADISQLGYSTFTDIINNYSSTDAAARFVLPKRVLDRMTPLVRMMPMKVIQQHSVEHRRPNRLSSRGFDTPLE